MIAELSPRPPNTRLGRRILALAFTLLTAGASARDSPSASDPNIVRCSAFVGMQFGPAKIVASDFVPNGPSSSGAPPAWNVPQLTLPASCRVRLSIVPVPGSRIASEVWLPAENWNGRYQGIGNGGLAGSIDRMNLIVAVHRGYAASATDTGHIANDTDADWAIGNPVAIEDYGWRAIHETAVAAKAVIARYYGKPPRFSYFGSASNGGREALIEAQRFPEDYDGILAGAPVLDLTGTVLAWAWMQKIVADDPRSRLERSHLRLLNSAVLSQCDALDGATDGILEKPFRCDFRPERLLCRSPEQTDCLRPAQIRFLHALYRGPTRDRRWGFSPGGEAGWMPWITGAEPGRDIQRTLAEAVIGKMAFGRKTWNVTQLRWVPDSAAVRRTLGPILNAVDPDLSRFHARGGKLIIYHGWNDPALPARPVLAYFEAVRAALGPHTKDMLRLYMVPGLEHVTGGPGPNVFGQIVPAGTARTSHDIGAALEAWVEHGVAPSRIIATKYDHDFSPLVTQIGLARRTRPLCPYPMEARWSGHGSIDDAASFVCHCDEHY